MIMVIDMSFEKLENKTKNKNKMIVERREFKEPEH